MSEFAALIVAALADPERLRLRAGRSLDRRLTRRLGGDVGNR
jgi:hypothetical protein